MRQTSSLWASIFISFIIIGCSPKERPLDNAQYKTMSVSYSKQTLNTEYSARLSAVQFVEIRPQVSGNIMRICIEEGDQVKQGQTLFIIDQVPYQAALQQAVANVKSAEARLATTRMTYESESKLHESNVVSDYSVQMAQNSLKEAEALLEQAKAQEKSARNNLSYTVVKSPVNGSTSMIPYHVGSLVSSNIVDPLVTVADNSEINAYFSITEGQVIDLIQQYGSVQEFLRQTPAVSLKLSNGTLYEEIGHIDAISGTVDASTGAVNLRATFPNPKSLLHEGGSATIIIPTIQNGIVIPQEATYELQNRMFVYKIVDGKTKATPIEVFRLNNGKEYIVEKGLDEGDIIIAEGAGLLREGIDIKSNIRK